MSLPLNKVSSLTFVNWYGMQFQSRGPITEKLESRIDWLDAELSRLTEGTIAWSPKRGLCLNWKVISLVV